MSVLGGPTELGFFEEADISQVLKERLALPGPSGVNEGWIFRYFQIRGRRERKWVTGPVMAYLKPSEAPACEGLLSYVWAPKKPFPMAVEWGLFNAGGDRDGQEGPW